MAQTNAKRKIAAQMDGRNLYRLWIPLLVLAALVPVGAILYSWSQTGFVAPMTLASLDEVTTNVAVFAAFLGLVALSFFVQYHYGSLKTRRGDVRLKALILVLYGIGTGLVALVLRWWTDPSSTPRSIVSYAVHKPLVVGSAVALFAGGLVLAFMLSSREEQRRVLRAALFFLAAFLVFGGPTYLVFVLQNVGLPYPVLVLGGLIAFVVGLILLVRLIGKQTKTGASE